MRFPRLTHRNEEAGADALRPDGWTQRFYQLNKGEFRFSKHTLELSDELFIETPHIMAGSLRVDGAIDPGRLLIGIFEGCENYRLLNKDCTDQMATVAYDGSQWNVVADAPGRGITLSAAGGLVDAIIPEEQKTALNQRMAAAAGKRSLLLEMFREAEALRTVMRQCLELAQSGRLETLDEQGLRWLREDLIEKASAVVDAVLGSQVVNDDVKHEQRAHIAHQIEEALWSTQVEALEEDLSVEILARRFACSRRKIQMAIDEQFGMSFTHLKRVIRLHQADSEIAKVANSGGTIARIATAHGFPHLSNFARYYREMYGVLPSEKLKQARA